MSRPENGATLPREWYGVWRGNLQIRPQPRLSPAKIPITLTITQKESGVWTFETHFDDGRGEDKKGTVKPYTLKSVPDEPDQFLLDENNGIVLDQAWEADGESERLIGAFTVGSQLLVSKYERRGKTLTYEIRILRINSAKFPHDVKSYVPNSVQSAVMTKI